MRDIAKKVVEKIGQHSHQAVPNDERLAALEKSHADLIAKLARHFPALF